MVGNGVEMIGLDSRCQLMPRQRKRVTSRIVGFYLTFRTTQSMTFPSLDAVEKRGQEHWGLADRFIRALLKCLEGERDIFADMASAMCAKGSAETFVATAGALGEMSDL